MFSLIVSVLSLFTVYANEPSQVNLSHSFSNTSDGLKMKTNSIVYETNRRDLFWNYIDVDDSATDLIFGAVFNSGEYQGTISGVKLFSGLGRKWNKNNHSNFKLGVHKLSYKDIDSSTPYAEFTQRLVSQKNTFELNLNYDLLYISGGVPGPYSEKLKRLQTRFNGVYTPKKFIRIPYGLEYTKISKDNSLHTENASILFGSSYPIWFWIGYHLERLSYGRTDVGYWSPNKFISHGPQVEWAQTFFSKLHLKASYLYSFIKENDGKQGNSYYASAAIEYGDRNSLFFGSSVYRNKSQQNSSEWWSEGGELYLKYSF